METGTWKVKTGHAQMLKGGVIMDVVSVNTPRLPKKPELVPLWRWRECLPIFGRLVGLPVWLTPA
jgi:hypothetical protein